MRIRMYSKSLGASVAGLAGLWLAASPAAAESPASPGAAQAEDQKATDECDCPCMDKPKEAKKSRVIYVGPRQNIPVEIDGD